MVKTMMVSLQQESWADPEILEREEVGTVNFGKISREKASLLFYSVFLIIYSHNCQRNERGGGLNTFVERQGAH